MPPKKKKARTSDAGARRLSFAEVAHFVRAMDHDALVDAVGEAWERSPALQKVIDDATSSNECWSAENVDQAEMLNFNWVADDGSGGKIPFKSTKADGKVTLPNVGWAVDMSLVREMCDDGEGFEDDDAEFGCVECNVAGSSFDLTLNTNRAGDMQLKHDYKIMCGCMGDMCEVDSGTYTFSVATDKEKKKKK